MSSRLDMRRPLESVASIMDRAMRRSVSESRVRPSCHRSCSRRDSLAELRAAISPSKYSSPCGAGADAEGKRSSHCMSTGDRRALCWLIRLTRGPFRAIIQTAVGGLLKVLHGTGTGNSSLVHQIDHPWIRRYLLLIILTSGLLSRACCISCWRSMVDNCNKRMACCSCGVIVSC